MRIFFKLLISLTVLFFSISSAVAGETVSAYLQGAYVEESIAKIKLKEAGFEVIASYSAVKDGVTLVFTNEALKAEGAKPKRAHAAILRMFIDNQMKTVSITNPIYFGKAFMQDGYKKDVFVSQYKKISALFPGLIGSVDKLKFDDLADFHFMMGMPYYGDFDILAKASNEELLTKARAFKDGKLLVFELKLSNNTTLLGYDLGSRTKKFVDKIGRANAAVLPYSVAVENGVASALAPKYYLAISYPLLTMGEFMTISTVPGAILQDLQKPFN